MGTIYFLSRFKNGYNEYLIPSKNSHRQEVHTCSTFKEFRAPITLEDQIYFYSYILSKLSLNQKVMGIPVWDVAQFIQISGKKYECIQWHHNINCHKKSNTQDFTFEDTGFCKAQSSESEPPFPQWINKTNSTGLFDLNNFNDIHDLLFAVKNDLYGEINLFILQRNHKKGILTSLLQKKNQPQIDKVLKKCEMVIDFVFSNDEKYLDCMLIKSTNDLSPTLDTLIQDYNDNNIVIDDRLEEIKTQKEKTSQKTTS